CGEGQGRIGPAWMAPHHGRGIAHKAAELDHGRGVGHVQVPPSGALLPRGHGAADGHFVEARGALKQAELAMRLHGTREHQGIVAVDQLDALHAEAKAGAQIIPGDPATIERCLFEGATHGRGHVEGVVLARALDPGRMGAAAGDEPVDVGFRGGEVERHHHGTERSDVLDPARLLEKGGQVIIGDDEDRSFREMARKDDGVGPRLVRLVSNPVEARQIEDVVGERRDEAVEAALAQREQQAVQIAKPLGQRDAEKRRGGRRQLGGWHAFLPIVKAPLALRWLVPSPLYSSMPADRSHREMRGSAAAHHRRASVRAEAATFAPGGAFYPTVRGRLRDPMANSGGRPMRLMTGARVAVLTLLVGASGAMAQTTMPSQGSSTRPSASNVVKAPVTGQIVVQDANTILAKDLIGQTVLAADKTKIGTISDLILSKDAKTVEGFVIGVGGFLGIGEK